MVFNMSTRSDVDLSKLEKLLGLDPGELEISPVHVYSLTPTGVRISKAQLSKAF